MQTNCGISMKWSQIIMRRYVSDRKHQSSVLLAPRERNPWWLFFFHHKRAIMQKAFPSHGVILVFNSMMARMSNNTKFNSKLLCYYSIISWTIPEKLNGINENPDSKDHEAYMGPTWGRQDPGGTHVGPMNLAIRECYSEFLTANVYALLFCIKP